MKRKILTIAVILGLSFYGCSKFETNHSSGSLTGTTLSLKQAVAKNTEAINTAASAIAGTNGYQLLSISDDQAKSESGYADSITLAMVAGIYDYSPDTLFRPFASYVPYKLFKKTGTSSEMIVNMPKKIVFHPKYLFNFYHADSAYNNNDFTITASDYHNYYSWADNYDYKLSAGFTLDSANMGTLYLISKADSYADLSYSSKYVFANGYNIDVYFAAGDTTTSSFALSDNDTVLLKETNVFIGQAFSVRGEREYILSIGNVDIKKTTGIDSIQVYLSGVLQKKAAVRIIDSTATTGSICNKRDLQITFDDGTTVTLSSLISPALSTLRTLVGSMQSMYFARNILDYIAYDIYYQQYKLSH
ncbi:MAG: hypothetical protein ABSG89_02865 [Bacteroidales bacterium]